MSFNKDAIARFKLLFFFFIRNLQIAKISH